MPQETAEEKRSPAKSRQETVIFLNLYRFQGSEKRSLKRTLKTAQPDGKHLVRNQLRKQFCSWSQEERIKVKTLTATQFCDDQVTKGAGWMPWHWTPKKDVVSCEKPRGAASRH